MEGSIARRCACLSKVIISRLWRWLVCHLKILQTSYSDHVTPPSPLSRVRKLFTPPCDIELFSEFDGRVANAVKNRDHSCAHEITKRGSCIHVDIDSDIATSTSVTWLSVPKWGYPLAWKRVPPISSIATHHSRWGTTRQRATAAPSASCVQKLSTFAAGRTPPSEHQWPYFATVQGPTRQMVSWHQNSWISKKTKRRHNLESGLRLNPNSFGHYL